MHTATTATAAAAAPSTLRETQHSVEWCAMHPHDKHALLCRLLQRCSRLLDDEDDVDDIDDDDEDEDDAATRACHAALCAALPYAARLQLVVSATLWLSTLCNVEATLARQHTPHSNTQRVTTSSWCALVYPTRPHERLVDAVTAVSVLLAGSVQHTPLPRTWGALDLAVVSTQHGSSNTDDARDMDSGGGAAAAADNVDVADRTFAYASAAVSGGSDGSSDCGYNDVRGLTYDKIAAVLHADGAAQRHPQRVSYTRRRRQRGGGLTHRLLRHGVPHADEATLAATATAAAATPARVQQRQQLLLQYVRRCLPRRGADDVLSAARAARKSVSFASRTLSSSSPSSSSLSSLHSVDEDMACRVAPVTFAEYDAHGDAVYHGNAARATGCPLDDSGRVTSTPIHITLPRVGHAQARLAACVRACVMAHAAVLSSLFVEGRTARVTTEEDDGDDNNNNSNGGGGGDGDVVSLYVRWLCAPLMSRQYVSVASTLHMRRHDTSKNSSSSSSTDGECVLHCTAQTAPASPSAQEKHEQPLLLPYYPAWCTYSSRRSVLLLVPPRTACYTARQARRLARAVVCGAPCIVLYAADDAYKRGGTTNATHDGSDAAAAAAAVPLHVRQLQEEVSRQCAQRLRDMHSNDDDDVAAAADNGIAWECVHASCAQATHTAAATAAAVSAAGDACDDSINTTTTQSTPHTSAAFVPRVHAHVTTPPHAATHTLQRCVTRTRKLLTTWWRVVVHAALPRRAQGNDRGTYVTATNAAAAAASTATRHGSVEHAHDADMRFLAAAAAHALPSYYMLHILYEPYNATVTTRELQHWVWTQLPDNVRVVGVNADPLCVLYYYPQATFLSHKVGNAARWRAVTRTLIRRDDATVFDEPLRATASALTRSWRHWRDETTLSPYMPTLPRARTMADATRRRQGRAQCAVHALVWERVVDYLTQPCLRSLIGLVCAKLLRL